jgi:integrase
MRKTNTRSYNRIQVRTITIAEVNRIVAALRSPEINRARSYYVEVADLIEVMVDTGIRLGEALELRNVDIDLAGRMIIIQATKCPYSRRVPMTMRVAAILKRRLAAGDQLLFVLPVHQVQMAWSWAKEQARIDDPCTLTLYSLRKTCAQRLMDAKVDLMIICEYLGHPQKWREHRLAPIPHHKLISAADMLETFISSHPSSK